MNNLLTVYAIAYNEEVVLPYFIKHYRDRFPECRIVIYDNYSTDKTEEIAVQQNCEVIKYDSGNTIRDDLYLQIKNNCWKTADTEWVFVGDIDEFLDITPELLSNAEFNMIKSEGWEMFGEDESLNIDLIDSGFKSAGYNKNCCFKPKDFVDVNYVAGAHGCHPTMREGCTLRLSNGEVKLFHYKWLNWEYTMNRYKLFHNRLSDVNKRNGWAVHYSFSEQIQRDYYDSGLKNREKIR